MTENTDIHEQASAWFLRLNKDGVDEEVRAAFETWLRSSEAHGRAYEDVEQACRLLDDAAAVPEIVTARRDALTRARRAAKSRWGVKPWPQWAALAASLLIFALGAPLLWRGAMTPADTIVRYETAIGESRVLTLEDNSKISLDAKTALSVHLTPELRLIDLQAGQAFFDVAKDPTRPFRVTAGGKTVVALGTAFNVEIVGKEVLVTLVEGRVAVTNAPETNNDVPSPPTQVQPLVQELMPGERLIADRTGRVEIARAVDVAKTTAWRQGKLIFEDEPLALAVERMNRYSRVTLVAGDEAAGALGISGVFNAGDTDAFVEALEVYFGIETIRDTSGTITIRTAGL